MYYILPETDKCTLEDIELHFSDNQKSLTDRKVARNLFTAPNLKNTEAGYGHKRESIPNVDFINSGYLDEKY